MQPRPRAETSRLLFPSFRFSIASPPGRYAHPKIRTKRHESDSPILPMYCRFLSLREKSLLYPEPSSYLRAGNKETNAMKKPNKSTSPPSNRTHELRVACLPPSTSSGYPTGQAAYAAATPLLILQRSCCKFSAGAQARPQSGAVWSSVLLYPSSTQPLVHDPQIVGQPTRIPHCPLPRFNGIEVPVPGVRDSCPTASTMWLPHADHSTSLTKPVRTSFPCGLLPSAISRPPLQCREHPPQLDPGSPREPDIRRVRLTQA